MDPEIVCGGLICSEHFRVEDFRNKDKSALKAKAIPTMFDSFESMGSIDAGGQSKNGPSQSFQTLPSCRQCQEYEQKIITYEQKIQRLQIQLKKSRNRNHYLHKMARSLKHSLEEMRKNIWWTRSYATHWRYILYNACHK